LRTFNLLVAAFALVQIVRYGRKALLFLFPRVRVAEGVEGGPRSASLLRAEAELEDLGFRRLGVLHERAALGTHALEVVAYANPERAAFADAFVERGAPSPRVQFFTPFRDGAVVLTADFERPTVANARVLASGSPEASLAEVLSAHETGVRRFATAHGPPEVTLDLAARLEAARGYYDGEGRRELAHGKALAFGLVVFGMVLLASALRILLASTL
jgi:hypothetical protein